MSELYISLESGNQKWVMCNIMRKCIANYYYIIIIAIISHSFMYKCSNDPVALKRQWHCNGILVSL